MRVVIAGGHGKIALRLTALLHERETEVVGLIRKPEHAPVLAAAGAHPVELDLEHSSTTEITEALRGANAVVFAAGAGKGSGAERKYTVDRDGSVSLAEAAEDAGVPRFLQISTMGAGQSPDPDSGEVWKAYIDAKTGAEQDLRSRDLEWTILRPGALTDDPGSGLVTLSDPPAPRGQVSRQDVAAVLAELLATHRGGARTLELTEGDTPVREAVAAL
ncbi:Nucleoside-diphosphate-sugar epimerase [Actinopolyspora mzabensis]|uniref:Nucleoside-diphosphate-sugar epimerase n=1 Tax=Actinopolyspora mzabensis TaxID=995066 RepID=A0A1G9A6Z2_ACTMZ|nr:SDR family oxidoreductase [Actinopolyspora mzabensis]SDK23096.1 Nucleoside-diphosphate-sugar epimerase [Actinopolyspora mzabensis]